MLVSHKCQIACSTIVLDPKACYQFDAGYINLGVGKRQLQLDTVTDFFFSVF